MIIDPRVIEMIWTNNDLRQDLAYTVPKGIPLSVFRGRVVGSEDQQWLDYDREMALAYEAAMADVCRKCGTRGSEWEKDPYDAYMGQLHVCLGCQRLEQEQRNIDPKAAGYTSAYLVPPELAVDDTAAIRAQGG